MASFIVGLFSSTAPKNSWTRRESSGWTCSSSWNAKAMLSKVTSSWVGPMPPEVMRCVYWGDRRATSLAMTSCLSGITIMRCTDTPSLLSARVRKPLLVSTVWPWEMTTGREWLQGLAGWNFSDSSRSSEGVPRHWSEPKPSCLNHYSVNIWIYFYEARLSTAVTSNKKCHGTLQLLSTGILGRPWMKYTFYKREFLLNSFSATGLTKAYS